MNESKIVINNEFDYSNVAPTIESVSYLVSFCYEMNNRLTKLVEDDENKNKQFKPEFQEFMYKHSFGQSVEAYIKIKNADNISCKNYSQFQSAVENGCLNSVYGLDIRLNMDYYRGKGNNLEEYQNSFKISFEPYNILFTRQSNHNDPVIDSIEKQINDILNKFPVVNTIFCNKNK